MKKKSADSANAGDSSDEGSSDEDSDELYNMDNLYNLEYDEADDEDQFDEEGNPLPVLHKNPLARLARGEGGRNSVEGIAASLRAAAIFRRTLRKTRASRKHGAKSPATKNSLSGGKVREKSTMKGVVSTFRAIGKFKNSIRKHRASFRAVEGRESASGRASSEGTLWQSNPAANALDDGGGGGPGSVLGARKDAVEIEMRAANVSPANERGNDSRKKSVKKTVEVMKKRREKTRRSNSKNRGKHFSLNKSIVADPETKDGVQEQEETVLRTGATSAYQRAKLSGVVLNRELFAESESGRIYAIDTIDGVDQPAHWISDESIHLDVTSGKVYLYDEESGVTEWLDDFDVRLDDRRV